MIATHPAPPHGPGPERTEKLTLHTLWAGLVRNRFLAIGMFVLFIGLAALLTWRATPMYESEATLQIDDSSPGQMLLQDLSPLAGMDRGRIETDMVVLRSRSLSERVMDSLGLQLQVVQPEGERSDIFSSVRGVDPELSGSFTLSRTADGSYDVTKERGARGEIGSLRIQPGVPARIGAIAVTLRQGAPERVRLRIAPYRDAVAAVRRDLGVVRPVRDAKVVHVRYRSSDPTLVAQVPNALTNAFIQFTNAGNKTETRSTVAFLRDQVGAYEAQLRSAETELRSFRESAQVVDLQAEGGEQIKQVAALRAERDQLATERDGLGAVLQRVRAPNAGPEAYRQLASFPTFLANRAVQDLLQTLTALENERLALLQRRTEENVDVSNVDARIRSLEQSLLQMASGYYQSLGTQLVSLDANLARFGTLLESLPAREVQFARLLRQQELLEEIYTLLQTRLKEAEIQLAVEPTDVRIIDEAVRPIRPVSPVPMLNFVLGAVLGLMAAGVAVFVRESLNTRIHSDADVIAATQGLPVLGTIPRIRRSTTAVPSASTNGSGNGNGNRPTGRVRPMRPEDLFEERLVMRRNPRSPVAEAYRSLRTNITFAGAGGAPRVVMLTSASPGDGKSTSASNLAITLAHQGTRVLLVDVDLRRGVLHQIFGVPQEPGLSHVLHLGTAVEEAIRTVVVSEEGQTLDLLPAGTYPPNPAELLGSPPMHGLIEALRARYDMIILDAPPVNVVTDASVVGVQADVTLLVARAGFTDRRALHHALVQLRHLGVRVGGVVLNDSQSGAAGYYAYGYGHG